MQNRSVLVRRLFTQIAPAYDRLNRLMTFGLDILLRREVVRRLAPQPAQVILDDGSGTGDLAFEILRQAPAARVVASDFTPAMLRRGQARDSQQQVCWVIADALHLPFAPDVFDGVVSGYLLRNVDNIPQALAEQRRVLRSGGKVLSLDTTPPRASLIQPLIHFYLTRIIPLLGRTFAGHSEAYTYLPQSTEAFDTAEVLQSKMEQGGFKAVSFVRRLVGSMAIHWGQK